MGLPCLNCAKDTSPSDAKMFGGVFVCKVCFDMAERLFTRASGELTALLNMMKEGIRIALIEGRLHFNPSADQEVSKRDLLEAVVKLQEMNDASRAGTSPGNAEVEPRPALATSSEVRTPGSPGGGSP